MEVVIREVQLQWPYLLQMGFLWDLLTVYCTCVFVPWARTFREVRPHRGLTHAALVCEGLLHQIGNLSLLAMQMQQCYGTSPTASFTALQERGETQWMYINILFENSELQVRGSFLYAMYALAGRMQHTAG
jgi:hypothetical protein